jgi:hypothetical protein
LSFERIIARKPVLERAEKQYRLLLNKFEHEQGFLVPAKQKWGSSVPGQSTLSDEYNYLEQPSRYSSFTLAVITRTLEFRAMKTT